MAQPLPLPPPRPLLHPLRSVETATTRVQSFPGHRTRVTIDHQPLAGITPSMLLWWFRHIGDSTVYAGEEMSGYLDPIQRAQFMVLRERLLERVREVREQRDDSTAGTRHRTRLGGKRAIEMRPGPAYSKKLAVFTQRAPASRTRSPRGPLLYECAS